MLDLIAVILIIIAIIFIPVGSVHLTHNPESPRDGMIALIVIGIACVIIAIILLYKADAKFANYRKEGLLTRLLRFTNRNNQTKQQPSPNYQTL